MSADQWCNCQDRACWHPHGDTSQCGPEPHEQNNLTVNEQMAVSRANRND